MSSTSGFSVNPARIRHYVLRIPVCTRLITAAIVVFFMLGWSSSLRGRLRLEPSQVFAGGAHRLTTYAFLHVGFIQLLLNLAVAVPLLERFESEYGTLVTLALFTGPFTTVPGLLYTLISTFLFHSDQPINGCSTWSFLLATSLLAQTFRSQPYLPVLSYRIPTVAIPVIAILLAHFLLPDTSILAHGFATLMGYAWGAGYLKILLPPEKPLRWIENKGKLLQRIPYYVSVDKTTYGRYGVLPTVNNSNGGVEMGRRSLQI